MDRQVLPAPGGFLFCHFCQRPADFHVCISTDLAGFVQRSVPFKLCSRIEGTAALFVLRKISQETKLIRKAVDMLTRKMPDREVGTGAAFKITLVRFRCGTRDNQELRIRIQRNNFLFQLFPCLNSFNLFKFSMHAGRPATKIHTHSL